MQIVLKHQRLLFVAGTKVHLVDFEHPSTHGEWTMCGKDYLALSLMTERTQDSATMCRRCLKTLRTYRRIFVEFK